MRRLFLSFVCLLLPLAAHAQDTPDWGTWETLLYDSTTGTVYPLNSNLAAADPIVLPAPADYEDTIPREVVVSRDGTTLAYMTYPTLRDVGQPRNEPTDASLMVYNRETEQVDAYPFIGITGHALDYPGSPLAFSPDNTQIALGYHQANGWNIAILDVANRSYSDNLLSQQTTSLVGAASTYEIPIPIVTNFDGQTVEFVIFPGEALEPPLALNSYAWNTTTGEVTPTVRFSSLDYAIFEGTNEVIQSASNETLPINPALPFVHFNVLEVATGPSERQPFYTSGQFSLVQPGFAQKGNKVIFQSFDADGQITWTAIDRSGGAGNVLSSPVQGQNLGIQDTAGTEFGALLVTDATAVQERLGLQGFGGTAVVHINLTDGTQTLDLVTSFEAPILSFIWTGATVTEPQTGYAAWAQVGEFTAAAVNPTPEVIVVEPTPEVIILQPTPTAIIVTATPSAPVATVTPVSQAAPVSGLSPGGTAQVFTTEGDDLNVRSGPGSGFAILGDVRAGIVVQVIEGPVQGDGLNWWRILAPSGLQGWAVEQVDGIQTLRPQIVEPTATPDGLFLGGQGVVAAEATRLRGEPSTQSVIVDQLGLGTQVTLIDGPVLAEGLTWWRVQVDATGQLGWMVEQVEDTVTLSPAG